MTTATPVSDVESGYSTSCLSEVQADYTDWFERAGTKRLIRQGFADDSPFFRPSLSERRVSIEDVDGKTLFERDCQFPAGWSDNACQIVASKYFTPGESSVYDLSYRVADQIADWGIEGGYFNRVDAEKFHRELEWLILNQAASFNSPVYFNVGVRDHPQCSACFINSVEDSMDSILDLAKTEARIFKEGSGSGVNLTNLRSSQEEVSGGGKASGPVSFMQMLDANAGVIKSGGRTRRSATMRILDMDHDDIEAFITSKGEEERKAHALIQQGYDDSLNGEAYSSVFFQNANHSVRVSDTDMHTALTSSSRQDRLMDLIAEEAWRCGDPGLQFSDTINKWHTCKADGEIVASNPCSEYLFLNDTSCNLASINVMAFATRDEDGSVFGFDHTGLRHAVRIMITAMDIIVSRASYPTERIAAATKEYRTLGLGITNLAAYLMARQIPYDSERARREAGDIVSMLAAEAHLHSTRIASLLGPYPAWERNQESHLGVIAMRKGEVSSFDPAIGVWEEAYRQAGVHGMRNAQLTVIAPTGTISFLMDCESTGIEPLISLSAVKKLSGGGEIEVTAKRCVIDALRGVRFSTTSDIDIEAAAMQLQAEGPERTLDLSEEYWDVFRTAIGERQVSVDGHIEMMAAIQPFICGGISKTVNLPSDSTVQDVRRAYYKAWEWDLKSIALYRDGSKLSQPLNAKKSDNPALREVPPATETSTNGVSYTVRMESEDGYSLKRSPAAEQPLQPQRRRLPDTRRSVTHHFRIGGTDGYVTIGEYEDGSPGEMFINVAKQGTALSGLLDSVGIAVSIGLQHGVPLALLAGKYKGMSFEPSGWANGEYHPSVMSYIFGWLERRYVNSAPLPSYFLMSAPAEERATPAKDSHLCPDCGALMQDTGTCLTCPNCGFNDGC